MIGTKQPLGTMQQGLSPLDPALDEKEGWNVAKSKPQTPSSSATDHLSGSTATYDEKASALSGSLSFTSRAMGAGVGELGDCKEKDNDSSSSESSPDSLATQKNGTTVGTGRAERETSGSPDGEESNDGGGRGGVDARAAPRRVPTSHRAVPRSRQEREVVSFPRGARVQQQQQQQRLELEQGLLHVKKSHKRKRKHLMPAEEELSAEKRTRLSSSSSSLVVEDAEVISPSKAGKEGEEATRKRVVNSSVPRFVPNPQWNAMRDELQRSLRFGNWAYNIASKELWWSHTSRNILRLGHGPEGRITHVEAFSKRIHPDDRKFIKILFNRAVTSGIPFDVSFRLIIPDIDKMFAGASSTETNDSMMHDPDHEHDTNINININNINNNNNNNNNNTRNPPPAPAPSSVRARDDRHGNGLHLQDDQGRRLPGSDGGRDDEGITEHLSSDGVPSVWCRMMCRVQFHSVTKRAEKLLGTIQDITSWAISVRAPQPTDKRKDGHGVVRIVNENHFVVDEEAKCVIC